MNIRELVINNANAKYPNNDYVSERVEKELHYFEKNKWFKDIEICLLYTSPSPRDRTRSRMPSSA